MRATEQIDSARDLVGNCVDAYLSVVANRTNDVTKQLTIFASIFMPLSFIVGFFGQNFELLSRTEFFYGMLVLMVTLPSTMLWWFRRSRWL
jgi:magnesium transporter